MKSEKINAVAMKRELQRKAEQKLSKLSEKEQIEFLRRRYGTARRSTKRRTRRQLQPA